VPEVEVEVDEALVRRLLAGLPPQWRHLRDAVLTPVATGWDNSVWRVDGEAPEERYAVRVPVRAVAAPIVGAAARWVPEVSAPVRRVGVRAAVTVLTGGPVEPLRWPWVLAHWVPGDVLTTVPMERRGPVADGLARALPALHRPAPAGAPVSPARGVTLAGRQHLTERNLPAATGHLGAETIAALLAVIDAGVAVPPWPHAPVWCHGDLHAANLTLDEAAAPAALGLLDFDDLTSGDPAVDLRALWLVLDEPQRSRAMTALEASSAYDEHVWTRARGWAASSFVLPIAADPQGRVAFADSIEVALAQLGVR
jgi:aminoglycoside phosphotransferase (APT) family kinase protein